MDQIKEIARALQNTLVLLGLTYIIHELIQPHEAPCPDCQRARVNVVPDGDEQSGEDQVARDGADAWPPRSIIRNGSVVAFAPGAGE
jgi:hypothetical protein